MDAYAFERTTTMTGTVGGRYSGTMDTVSEVGDVAEMQGDKGRKRA